MYRDLNIRPTEFHSEKFFQQFVTLFNPHEIIVRNNVSSFFADPVLLEQVIINLLKNSIEACSQTTSEILIMVDEKQDKVKISIVDKGQGIANPENLFVPFYTTKENGSGIGLVLCRNIIEQHGGSLTLSNNDNGVGVTAEIILPVSP
ncbi:MAG: GHKL domain-containing protein [Alteromonadaceae bacterium]|nr:GHKL domain-containing protein [Alteromonadaceae bacterium]